MTRAIAPGGVQREVTPSAVEIRGQFWCIAVSVMKQLNHGNLHSSKWDHRLEHLMRAEERPTDRKAGSYQDVHG